MLVVHSGHRLNQLCDAFDPAPPFLVQRIEIGMRPILNGRKHADDFFLTDFHGPAYGAFPGTAVGQSCFDQSFSAQQDAGTLWPAQTLSAAETIEINAHFCVAAEIVKRGNARCIIQQQGNCLLRA